MTWIRPSLLGVALLVACAGKAPGDLGSLVRLEPGVFPMGAAPGEEGGDPDERPQHEVRLTRAFLLQATEVTQGQWRAVMGSNPSEFHECGDTCPVEYVSWFDAVAFANAVSRRAGLEPCYEIMGTDVRWPKGLDCGGYRLPTEAEWEYAARAGTKGDRYGDLDAVAWHEDNAGISTHPVGQKLPNPWGLYDVLGNVWEWCWDWSAPYGPEAVVDPTGPATGTYRVLRGGSWTYSARFNRAAFRNHNLPGEAYMFLGLRLARTAP